MAGLFDFNPQTFAQDPNAGLLARLGGIVNAYPTNGGGASMPPTAQPTAGLMPPPAAQAQQQPLISSQGPSPGFLDQLQGWIGQHQNTLASLGAGIASGGLARGLQQAVPGMQVDRQVQLQQAQQQSIYQAMKAKGASDAEAIAAMFNPKIMETQFAKPQFTTIGEDMFGNKKYGFVDPTTSRVTPWTPGQPIPGEMGAQSSNVGMSGQQPTLENFSMDKVNPNVQGWDYLKQYPKEVEDAAKAYMAGDVMPTGNPRNNGISTIAKVAAQKVAADLGQPQLADDTLYPARRTMRTGLASSGNSSIGGILSNGKSAFDHLANLSDKYVDLGNFNGPNTIGGALIGATGNFLGNSALTGTAEARGKVASANDNALKYGQEATKFYAGSGGGEAERMNALHSVDPATAPPDVMAGFLQTEKELMLDRLGEKEKQIRETLGQGYLDQHPVMTPDLQANISKVDANIARLRGGGPQATQPTQPTAQPPVQGARRAPDGNWYVPDPSRPGKYLMVH